MSIVLKSNNVTTLVDAEDYKKLLGYKWYLLNGRAVTRTKDSLIHMSRLVLNAPKGVFVDHINRNPLDNRKENLRLCSSSQNLANKALSKRNKSGVRGVNWDKQMKKWRAQVVFNNKHIFLGLFDSIEEAGKAYDKEARKCFGEFAVLNNI